MNDSHPHYFIAVPVPKEVQQQVHQLSLSAKQRLPFKQWVFPADYHITLQFLGAVSDDQVNKLHSMLQPTTAASSPFSLQLNGWNTFGSPRSPRILWIGVQGELQPLSSLQIRITDTTAELGFPTESRAYTPHITVAKHYTGPVPINKQWLQQEELRMPSEARWEVTELVLYRIYPQRQPKYAAVYTYPLSAPQLT